ncbi:hypothetical protein KM043_011395 [Ampulex compressa]|nr:hypothetical protein KM043_011395 [Ampulex compressa]
MDSPVIVDNASKFGRRIDLDSSFPGFPFDDDGFGRRSDIRAHLDDLATRHPEFADQLLGPPWGNIPFHGSFRNRRRGSGNNGYPSCSDEDSKSQASGSSGASGLSSNSAEPEYSHTQQHDAKRNPIPQYGLRNTVDIGQHRHNMDNADKGSRGQRSMSAPPENRQQPLQKEQQEQQPQGQRFVSRVDITPQHNQQQPHAQKSPSQQQQQQQPPKPQQQQSNVRHIPIFVEGRDEPVVPKNVEEPVFRREPSPTQFQAPPQYHGSPHFNRSAPFSQHFGGRQHQWPSHFQEFYQPQSTFEQPAATRWQQQPQGHSKQQAEKQRLEPQQQQPEQQRHVQQQAKPQPPQQQQQQQPQQFEQQEQQQSKVQAPQIIPKPKPAPPKDALERVALVQKEVDALAEYIKGYSGNSRDDREYMYLDEMLTRELIKLDDIDTEGKENVRQARKNAIKSIQGTIAMLESKAPLPAQQEMAEDQSEQTVDNAEESNDVKEPMDVDVSQGQETQSKQAIPLPPGPSSPTKKSEDNDVPEAQDEGQKSSSDQCTTGEDPKKEGNVTANHQVPMNTALALMPPPPMMSLQLNAIVPSNQHSEDSTAVSDEAQVQQVQEEVARVDVAEEKKSESDKCAEVEQKNSTAEQEKMEVDGQQGTQSPKKAKKTKKQGAVVATAPIPLPAPENTETTAK